MPDTTIITPPEIRFNNLTLAVPFHSCWEWLGYKDAKGYGAFKMGLSSVKAHRFSYELYKGPIPRGMVIDHLCRNRGCVRPDHLEAVDNRTNILRGEGLAAKEARRTHCYRGHPLAGDNLYSCKNQRSRRRCLQCKRIDATAWAREKYGRNKTA